MTDDKSIYGVGLDKPITPLMAREALVECFFRPIAMMKLVEKIKE